MKKNWFFIRSDLIWSKVVVAVGTFWICYIVRLSFFIVKIVSFAFLFKNIAFSLFYNALFSFIFRVFKDTFFICVRHFIGVEQVALDHLPVCNKTKVSEMKLRHKKSKPFGARKKKSISLLISFHFMKFSTASCIAYQKVELPIEMCWLQCVNFYHTTVKLNIYIWMFGEIKSHKIKFPTIIIWNKLSVRIFLYEKWHRFAFSEFTN